MSAYVVAVAGGSASGKTTFAQRLHGAVGRGLAVILQQDCYYRPLGEVPAGNFDHPEAFDNPLFIEQVEALKRGEPVQRPVYNFIHHNREPEPQRVDSLPVLIIEGLMVWRDPRLRRRLDLRIYIEAKDDVRLARRIERDTMHRGRTVESVIRQYRDSVEPMHKAHVQPQGLDADLIVPGEGHNAALIDLLALGLRQRAALASET